MFMTCWKVLVVYDMVKWQLQELVADLLEDADKLLVHQAPRHEFKKPLQDGGLK